ncbi:MAG: DNA glycosylase, partial [Chthoniobacterales bacterium]
MKLKQIIVDDFDLEKTLNCGQVFHWGKTAPGFAGAVGDKAVYLEQRRNKLFFTGISEKQIVKYLALDHSLGEICRS